MVRIFIFEPITIMPNSFPLGIFFFFVLFESRYLVEQHLIFCKLSFET